MVDWYTVTGTVPVSGTGTSGSSVQDKIIYIMPDFSSLSVFSDSAVVKKSIKCWHQCQLIM